MTDHVVQLFVTCLVDGFFPEVGVAAVSLIEDAGYRVEFPMDQTCCGQPAFNAGFTPEARAMVQTALDVLDGTSGPIVVPSGSCAEMLIHHAPEVVAGSGRYVEKAERVAQRVQELSQFLTEVGGPGPAAAPPGPVAYHPSCHGLRGLDIRDDPERMIDAIPGCDRVPVEDATECCGFGGLFSIEMPEVSAKMLEAKLDRIEQSGARIVVGGDVSCLMHIEGGLRRRGSDVRTCHLAEALTGAWPE